MSATPAKVKKAAKPKKPSTHPKYSEMIAKAIAALKERGGSSRQAILRHIMANFNVGKDANPVNSRLKIALRKGVASGALKQSKGKGASGSFRLGEKPAAKKAAKPKKAKKAAKAKKPAAEGEAAKPKKAAKKSPKKPKAAKPKKPKSPKKAKAAKPKKAKSPKKAAAKKPKAKKSPKKAAKKAAKK